MMYEQKRLATQVKMYIVIPIFKKMCVIKTKKPQINSFVDFVYGYWIYNYICSLCLSPLKLRVQILLMTRCT